MDWRVTHIWREANGVADYLANQGAEGMGLKIFHANQLPRKVQALAKLDTMGLPYIRLQSSLEE